MLRRKVVKQDVKLVGAARDAANRERASELAEAKARARKQVAFLTAQVAQATKDAQAERLRKLRESIDSARVEDNKHLSRRESLVLSLDSSDDEEEDDHHRARSFYRHCGVLVSPAQPRGANRATLRLSSQSLLRSAA